MEKRNSIPIVGMVRLTAAAGRLTVTGTDLDAEATVGLSGFSGPDFDLCADPWAICKILAGAADVEFLPPACGETRLGIKVGASVAHLAVLPVVDFPIMYPPTFTATALIDAAQLRDAFGFVAPYISQESTRYYLNGANLRSMVVGGQRVMRVEATDGHRMAVQTLEQPGWEGEPPNVIIPRKAVEWLAKHLPAAGDVIVEMSAHHVRVTLPDGAFTLKVIEGHFPDVDRVIPRDAGTTQVTIPDAKAFAAEVKRLASLSDSKSPAVSLTIARGTVEGSVRNMEGGAISGDLPAAATGIGAGHGFAIGFNAGYLADMCSGPAVMHVAGPNDPIRFAYDGRPDRVAVLMPIRA